MKRFLQIIALFAVIFIVSATNSQAIKRVLLEQHTGAWCGWCVDGTVVMDEILAKYPDQVIGVKFHNGDGMVITEEGILAQQMGLTGFPTGDIDRIVFNLPDPKTGKLVPTIFASRAYWMACSDYAVTQAPVVDVSTFYQYNSTTRELTITITANTLASNLDEWAFNAYICENDVTGTGTAYDQHNYLSGLAGFESNPYYSKPAVITNYHHMKVVRAMLGGAWGTSGKIPKGTASGKKIEHTYTYALPGAYNANNIFVVGLVQKYDPAANGNRQILNCAYGIVGYPSSKLTSTGPATAVIAKAEKFTKSYTLQNTGQGNIIFKVELLKSTETPADWNAIASIPEVTLAANATQNITVDITPGTAGIGNFTLVVSEKSNQKGYKSSDIFTVASAEIEALQVIADNEAGKYSMSTMLNQKGHTNFTNINYSDFTSIAPNLTNLKTIFWNGGEAGAFTAGDAQVVSDLMSSGKNVLICGGSVITTMATASPKVLDQLGVKFTKQCWAGANIPTAIGYDGDPISNQLTLSMTLINYYTFGLLPTQSFCKPLLRNKDVDTILAVRSQLANSRAIVLGFNPSIITNVTDRNNFMDKCLKWLEGTMAEIAVTATKVSFTNTEIGQTDEKIVSIQNKGKEDLNITDIQVDLEMAHIFKVKSGTTLTVPGGESRDVTLTFKPAGKIKYVSFVTFTSNSASGSELKIDIEGTGIPVSISVEDEIALSMVQLSVAPNPCTERSTINMSITDKLVNNLELTLVSETGTELAKLANGTYTAGEYAFPISAGNYASGTYYLIARINGISKQIPIVIVK